MKTTDELKIKEIGPNSWQVLEEIVFTGRSGREFAIPAGFKTDLASVPRIFHALVPKTGAHNRAAVLHDLLWQISKAAYRGRLYGNDDGTIRLDDVVVPNHMNLDPVDVDGLFRRAMRELGVSFPRRWTMWAAVRSTAVLSGRVGAMTGKAWAQLVSVWAAYVAPVMAVAAFLADRV